VSLILTEACPVARMARIAPEAEAVVDGDATYDYAGFHAVVSARSERLSVSPGSRLAVCAAPSFAYLCLLFAAWRQGGLVFPLSPRLPAASLAAVLAEAGVTQLFTDESVAVIEGVEVFDLGRASRSRRRSGIPARTADAQAL
jgi:acyl-CoA synthetase (AMP-forming)/AMP-acid ligase II